MSQLTINQLLMLMAPQGRQALAAAADVAGQPLNPAAIERLRRHFSAEMVTAAIQMVDLRRRAAERFTRAAGMFFHSHDLLEQATSEPIARHKGCRFAGLETVTDLCCGAGGDALAIAEHAARVIGLDISPTSLLCLRANAEETGLPGRIWQVATDITNWTPTADACHIDPPRRDTQGRRFKTSQSADWVELVEQMAHEYKHLSAKLSPAIDPAQVSWADEIEFISENGTLKQAITWTGCLARHRRTATVIRSQAGQTRAQETLASDCPKHTADLGAPLQPGRILHEPDPSVIRAGLLGNLAERLGAALIDPHLPLLSSTVACQPTLLSRPYEVLEVLAWSAKKVKQFLRQRTWHVTDVKTRAFACRPEEILASLKGHAPSPDALKVTLWAIRLGRSPVCLLTKRL